MAFAKRPASAQAIRSISFLVALHRLLMYRDVVSRGRLVPKVELHVLPVEETVLVVEVDKPVEVDKVVGEAGC